MKMWREPNFWTDDSGVAGFVIAILFAIAALAATMVFLQSDPEREVAGIRSTAANLEKINDAITVYTTQDAGQLLPCPADGTVLGAGRGAAPAPIGGACTLKPVSSPSAPLVLRRTMSLMPMAPP